MDEKKENLKEVIIYTDGGCDPNPGPGGFGVVMHYGSAKKELSGGFKLTTNNRMELLAVIVAIEALKYQCSVIIYSDSKYVVNGVNEGWAQKWKENDWKRNKKEKAINIDLWDRLLNALEDHEVEIEWVKGHAGIPGNERADELAMLALKGENLPEDEGYIISSNEDIGESKSIGSKMIEVGQPCRKCKTLLIKREPKKRKRKPGQEYYYEWYLYCPGCDTMYYVDEGKKHFDDSGEIELKLA